MTAKVAAGCTPAISAPASTTSEASVSSGESPEPGIFLLLDPVGTTNPPLKRPLFNLGVKCFCDVSVVIKEIASVAADQTS